MSLCSLGCPGSVVFQLIEICLPAPPDLTEKGRSGEVGEEVKTFTKNKGHSLSIRCILYTFACFSPSYFIPVLFLLQGCVKL